MSEPRQVGEMEGRDLDACVAREVMGRQLEREEGVAGERWVLSDSMGPQGAEHLKVPLPRYSTDMGAAWRVLEVSEYSWAVIQHDGRYICMEGIMCSPSDFVGMTGYEAEADTAPLAICRAALQAVRAT